MTVRFPSSSMPQTWAYSQSLRDYGGSQIPFALVDHNRSGLIKHSELADTLHGLMPGLSKGEAKQVAEAVFKGLGNPLQITPEQWPVAERLIMDLANTALAPRAPAGWGRQGDIQMPMGDAFTTDPRAAQKSEMSRPAKGAVRTGVGLLKQLPVIGNILNGIDFVRDLGKLGGALLDPRKTTGDKLKAAADTLMHGIGIIAPNVGGAYDMMQGVGRMAMGKSTSDRLNDRLKQLPSFNFDPGHYAPLAPMPYSMNQSYGYQQNPGYQHPLTWNQQPYQTPNYLPHYGNPNMSMIPSEPWNMQRYPQYDYGQQYGQVKPQYSPYFNPNAPDVRAIQSADKETLKGAARIGVGALKFVPILGNVLNGIDFVRGIGKLARSFVDPNISTMKAGADLLFHGIGIFANGVGASYDLVQGYSRAKNNDPSRPDVFLKHMSRLPEFQYAW